MCKIHQNLFYTEFKKIDVIPGLYEKSRIPVLLVYFLFLCIKIIQITIFINNYEFIYLQI